MPSSLLSSEGARAAFEQLEPRLLLSHSVLAATADRGVVGGVTVDFVMYPLETYQDKTWSHWGEGIVASNGKVYTGVGDHNAPTANPPVAGNSFIYEYDPETMLLQCIADLQEGVSDFDPNTDWGFGKVHGRISEGPDGNLYFASYWGDNPGGNPDYEGEYIFKLNPYTGAIVDVNHVDGQPTIADRSMPSTNMWGEGMIFYAETTHGSTTNRDFLVYDLTAAPEDAIVYLGDHTLQYNRDFFVGANGDAWFNAGSGTLQQYDISEKALGITVSGMPGSEIRRVTQPDANGYLYGTTNDTNTLFRFDPATGQFKTIMSLGRNIAGMDIDPTGRYIYYIPSAHTSSDGTPLYQVDITDINNPVRTTIVSLGSYLTSTYGFPVGGSYSLMVSQDGAVVYAQLNDNFDSRPYDPGFVAIHIPPGEANFKDYPVSGETKLEFADVAPQTGIVAIADQYSHTAAWGDVNNDGYPDLYFGAFKDGQSHLLINNNGTSFTESVQTSINIEGRASGSVFVDLDNDGDQDLVVATNARSGYPIGNRIYRNEGTGVYTDVTAGSNLDFGSSFSGRNVMVLDYDGDGLLDLFMQQDTWGSGGSRLMRNTGDFVFDDVTSAAGIPGSNVGIGGAVGDINGDTWGDIVTIDTPGTNRIFINNTDGTFRSIDSGVINSGWPSTSGGDNWCAGAALGDLDNDGDLDLVIGQHYEKAIKGTARVEVRAYRNDGTDGSGNPILTDITSASGIVGIYAKQPHVEIKDFDNDGDMDIMTSATIEVAGVIQPVIYANQLADTGSLTFALPPGMDPTSFDGEWVNPRYYPGSPTADFNRDGKLDIFGEEVFPDTHDPVLFQNTGATEAFLDVAVDLGVGSGNINGIGALVQIYEPGKAGDPSALLGTQLIETGNGFSSGSAPVAHFGTPMYTQYSGGSNARAHGGWSGSLSFVDVVVTAPCGGPVWTATVATNRKIFMPGGGGLNMRPDASFSPDTSNATTGNLQVDFDATTSQDSDGVIVSYQWDFGDGNTGSGATTTHTYATTGTYTVTLAVVDNTGESDTCSHDVILETPTIVTQPSDQTVDEGQVATFTVDPTGTEPLGYQWERNDGGGWGDIPGATDTSYTTPTVGLVDSGTQYRCTVANNLGATASDDATLTVNEARAITFIAQPADVEVSTYRKGKFVAQVDGSWPFDYQWQKNDGSGWSDIAGASGTLGTSPATIEYWTPIAQSDDDGTQFRVRVTNIKGLTTSDPATLTVSDPLTVSETWTATDGSLWSSQWSRYDVSGTPPTVNIDGNTGKIQTAGSAKGNVVMYINTASAIDTEQVTKLKVSSNVPEGGLIARLSDSNKDTFYGVEVGTTKSDDLEIFSMVDGEYTILYAGGDGSQIPKQTWYWMRFHVTQRGEGTDIQLKMWRDGTPEPAHWTAEVLQDTTPELQNIDGRVGVWGDMSHTGRKVWFDDYSATMYLGKANIPPTAEFTAEPSSGRPPLTVNFDASGSSDDVEIVSYDWDFGDGHTASGITISHQYTNGGTYTATLTVTDNDGDTGTAVTEITAIPNTPPTPVINADPTTGLAPLTVNFDATGSSDDVEIVSYEWDFGDTQTGTGATISHEYATMGTYTVTLTVTDNEGASVSETTNIMVTHSGNAVPVAVISANRTDGIPPLIIEFDGIASWDPDGTIVSWAWNFGDGVTAVGPTVIHQYNNQGTYTVMLLVTDNASATDTETIQITVAVSTNLAPVAVIETSLTDGTIPLTVEFDGTASYDEDGTVVAYSWNFGDGQTATGPTAMHVYRDPGMFTATLTVTDNEGRTDSASVIITPGQSKGGPDERPPYVLSIMRNRGAWSRSRIRALSIQFNEDVFPSLDPSDFSVEDSATGWVMNTSQTAISRVTGTNTALWDLTTVNFPDSVYTLTVSGSQVSDTGGNLLDGNTDGVGGDDYTQQFCQLSGDTDGNGIVNVGDLGIMAGHYGMSGDWWELPGDMNCDGRVDLADALIVGARFGNSLEQMGFLGVTGAGYTDTSKSAAPMGRPLVSVNSLENTDLQYSAPEASDGFDPLTTDLSIKPGTDSFEQASYRTAFDDEPETNRFDLEPPIDILQSALKNPLTLQGTGHSSVR